jgi:hypothetical protein
MGSSGLVQDYHISSDERILIKADSEITILNHGEMTFSYSSLMAVIRIWAVLK